MKFLCLPCDAIMRFEERQLPGDGTMGVVFACPGCGAEIAMLANPMETQMVSSLGIQIGGAGVPPQPMELTRGAFAKPRPGSTIRRVRGTPAAVAMRTLSARPPASQSIRSGGSSV